MTWSNQLQQQTRNIFSGKGDLIPMTDILYFKNINGGYAGMALDDYLRGRLVLSDSQTKQCIEFDSIDALLQAGWVID